jgi:hypothetical protein
MKLSELKPKSVSFQACGVPLTFRPFLIADDLKTQEIIGTPEEFLKALSDLDFERLSKLAWYQLDIRSQREVVKAVEGVYIDDKTGEEVDAKLTPLQKLQQLFTGPADQMILVQNLLNCRGLNVPDLDDTEKVKKWVVQLEELAKPIGQ